MRLKHSEYHTMSYYFTGFPSREHKTDKQSHTRMEASWCGWGCLPCTATPTGEATETATAVDTLAVLLGVAVPAATAEGEPRGRGCDDRRPHATPFLAGVDVECDRLYAELEYDKLLMGDGLGLGLRLQLLLLVSILETELST